MPSKPIIFTVDDEPEVLKAIEQDLRRQYGGEYRILRANSASAALDALKKIKLRNEPIALLVVDQRMPGMTGIELLEQAMPLFPDARRVLLTAYADTDVAIRAINQVKIHYYLLKPWSPPEEHLYPVLDDLLDEWRAVFRPPFEGIRIIGNRWSPKTHHIREYLARNLIPYQWFDIEGAGDAKKLVDTSGIEALPLLLFPDGSAAGDPSITDIAMRIGLKTQPLSPFYDLVIVGAGPAGLAAAVYGASEGLKTVIIEREAPGGQAGTSSRIENYLGFPIGLSGADLARRAVTQARRFGVEILTPQEVSGVSIRDPYRVVKLADGGELTCQVLLIATGVSYRLLDVPGIEKLNGAGVYYGATLTEAMLHQGEDIYIIGGANSAGQAAMHFSKFARSVTMLIRRDSLALKMSQYLVHQIAATPNIRVLPYTTVTAVEGDNSLRTISLFNSQTGISETVPAGALFIFIGARPHTDWLGDTVERNEHGYIVSGMRLKNWPLERDPFLLETSVPGIFVAGDVRHTSVKRVASAVGEGAMSVQFMHKYLAGR